MLKWFDFLSGEVPGGLVLLIVFLLAMIGCNKPAEETKVETEDQKASYAVGYNMGIGLRDIAGSIDMEIVLKGMMDAVNDVDTPMTNEEMQKMLQEFWQAERKKQMERRKVEGGKNKADGEAFLKENAQKEGVKVTDSGLQYVVIKEGDGPKPKVTDSVKVHYRGTLIDGNEFDSSYSRDEPAVFPLQRVIKGWTEGLQLMNVGSKYKFFVPSELAYGANGARGAIGPRAALIFEVELLGIETPEKKKEEPKPAK